MRKSVSVPPNLRKPGDRAVARARSLGLLREGNQETEKHCIHADYGFGVETKHGKYSEDVLQ